MLMKYFTEGEFKNSYRPRSLDHVVGHASIKKFLRNSMVEGTLPQVMLFYGPRGVGKTTIARIIAAGLNCTDEQDKHLSNSPKVDVIAGQDMTKKKSFLYSTLGVPPLSPEVVQSLSPCGSCPTCRSIFSDSSPDFKEINVADKTGIGNVRDLIETFKFSPMYLNNKVYILDEIHMMSKAAQSGLLKSLEDTPKNVYIIFCTTDKEPLISTLLDRCYDFCFKGLNEKELLSMIEDIVVTEGKLLNGDIVKCLIDTAEGSARRLVVNLHKVLVSNAQTIEEASEVLGTEIMQQQDMKHLSKAIMAADNKTALKIIDKYSYSDCDIARKSLINYFGVMLLRIGASKSINKANKISNIIDVLSSNITNPSKGLFVNDIYKITT